jgi:hypothetical protein
VKTQCKKLHVALPDDDSYDVNGADLLSERRVLCEIIPEGTGTALEALQFLKSLDGSFLMQI